MRCVKLCNALCCIVWDDDCLSQRIADLGSSKAYFRELLCKIKCRKIVTKTDLLQIEGHMRHCQRGRKCLRRDPLITRHLSVCHKTMFLCPNSETGSSNARISRPIISSWTNKAQSVAEKCSLLWLQSGHSGESGFFQSLNSFSISLFSICECFLELTALFNRFLPIMLFPCKNSIILQSWNVFIGFALHYFEFATCVLDVHCGVFFLESRVFLKNFFMNNQCFSLNSVS